MRLPARLAIAVATSAVALSGCGSASEPSPPTGVDGLVIPSPSLDPADFVERVDNPWLPLAVGNEWTYRRTAGGRVGTVTVEVLAETREVQGVTAAVVEETAVDERAGVVEEKTTLFAQDDDGNVWRLGEEGLWEAGVDGAEAGLAMPSRPRLGDGFATEYAAGVAEDRAQVVGVDGSASVPYGDLTGLLELEVTSPLVPGAVEREYYARGVGLVRSQQAVGGDEELVLVDFERG